MSDTTAPSGSSVCPSTRTLLGHDHPPLYQCVTVMVFWNDSAPGANDGKPNVDRFYLHNYPLRPWNQTTRAKLENDIMDLILHHEGKSSVNRVAYMGREDFPLTDEEKDAKGWHFICGSHDDAGDPPAPVPAPAPDPAPVPPATPEPAPMPDPAPEPVPAPAEPSTEPPATPEPPPPPSPADTVPDDHPHPLDVTAELTDEQKAEIVRWLPGYLSQIVAAYNVERKASAVVPWLEGHSTVEDSASARNAIEPILGGSPPDDLYQVAVRFCRKTISKQPGWQA
jgi:hypothetical protein